MWGLCFWGIPGDRTMATHSDMSDLFLSVRWWGAFPLLTGVKGTNRTTTCPKACSLSQPLPAFCVALLMLFLFKQRFFLSFSLAALVWSGLGSAPWVPCAGSMGALWTRSRTGPPSVAPRARRAVSRCTSSTQKGFGAVVRALQSPRSSVRGELEVPYVLLAPGGGNVFIDWTGRLRC